MKPNFGDPGNFSHWSSLEEVAQDSSDQASSKEQPMQSGAGPWNPVRLFGLRLWTLPELNKETSSREMSGRTSLWGASRVPCLGPLKTLGLACKNSERKNKLLFFSYLLGSPRDSFPKQKVTGSCPERNNKLLMSGSKWNKNKSWHKNHLAL